MNNTQIHESISEVLDILEHMDKIYLEKISTEFRKFLYTNKSPDYVSTLDHTKNLEEMNLNEDTKNLLFIIYIMFWCTEEERAECIAKQKSELNKNFNPDDLFANKKSEKGEVLPVEVKEKTFIEKIIDFIKRIFHI